MKKIPAILLALIFIVSFTACGGGNSNDRNADKPMEAPSIEIAEPESVSKPDTEPEPDPEPEGMITATLDGFGSFSISLTEDSGFVLTEDGEWRDGKTNFIVPNAYVPDQEVEITNGDITIALGFWDFSQRSEDINTFEKYKDKLLRGGIIGHYEAVTYGNTDGFAQYLEDLIVLVFPAEMESHGRAVGIAWDMGGPEFSEIFDIAQNMLREPEIAAILNTLSFN